MDKKIMAVAVVAIVIVAAFAVYFTRSSPQSSFSVSAYPDSKLTVLGNADLDNDFDENDVTVIQNLIDKGNIDYAANYMCDANFDGGINQDDIDVVKAIIAAQGSGDWSAVGNVYYVNVDKDIVAYDMTKSNKVITLIAPPLDSVLAMGGKDLVVGFDDRITTGKYHSEYAKTFDFSKMVDVGSCNEPDTETILKASEDNGGSINVVCGTKESYGSNMEDTFSGTGVQVIRIASWEYGEALYGFATLAFLLKMTDGAKEYLDWYSGCESVVQNIVNSVDPSKRSAGGVGAAAAYGYGTELSLLGTYSGEHATIMTLDPYDSATAYLNGSEGGGHGNTISGEDVVAMYNQFNLRNLALMTGTPFQVSAESGDATASQQSIIDFYNHWCNDVIGTSSLSGLNVCMTGYSFSSGVSQVLNELILCYWMYNDEFLSYFHVDQIGAQDILAGYVDAYCKFISIDDLWSFYGGDNGGKAGTIGMNLLYCGEGSEINIMYGIKSGSIDVGDL